MLEQLERRFDAAVPGGVDHCTLRFVNERHEIIGTRQGVLQPVRTLEDAGVMITVFERGGAGYAATSDLTPGGLREAARRAREWARRSRERSLVDHAPFVPSSEQASYESPVEKPWKDVPLSEKVDLLRREDGRLKASEAIVDWHAGLWHVDTESLQLTSAGGRLHQRISVLVPSLSATANRGVETQTRTLGAHACARQGGLEVLDALGYRDAAPQLAADAIELLDAPDCPSGTMDLLLDPDQMILQIHESIGHPLELDRILGDERNYAGTSFVTPDMFGTYQYGSELLNVTFDPTRPEQLASYGWDDEGRKASREHLIEKGLLVRPLGGATSQARAGLGGVANARATGWNRPPIDRMANINLEPGTSTFEEMVATVERGVWMKTNCSWSIDDSRNKFQFGCEWARLIENGELGPVVKKPNYRGISATFWRNLAMVGDESTLRVLGTPFCGKGEPNQIIMVGHASPQCLFRDVAVFGGA